MPLRKANLARSTVVAPDDAPNARRVERFPRLIDQPDIEATFSHPTLEMIGMWISASALKIRNMGRQ